MERSQRGGDASPWSDSRASASKLVSTTATAALRCVRRHNHHIWPMERGMAENKTQPTTQALAQFLDERVSDPERRKDCETIAALMEQATGRPPVIWGGGIVGFGKYHYKYDSGREGDSMVIGFSPRKTDLTLYVTHGLDKFPDLLPKLGKYKHGKSCLYIKKLSDVDMPTLTELIQGTVDAMKTLRVD